MGRKINRELHYGGKTFKFKLTDHLDPGTSRDTALKEIAKWILDEQDDDRWSTQVPWMREREENDWLRILTSFRVARIDETHPLFRLLDEESRRTNRNFLIFRGHISHVSEITVTHFGPFSAKDKLDRFKDGLEKVQKTFKKLLESLGIWSQSDWDNMSSTEKDEKQAQIKKQIDENFMKLMGRKKSALQSAKNSLKRLTKGVFGPNSNETQRIVTCISKAVTKTLLREVVVLIEKEIAKQIGKIAAKQGGKKAAGSALKKVPVIGLLTGGVFALGRLTSGDGTGALMELGSGAASCIPGAGTAASVVMDVAIAGRDIGNTVVELQELQRQIEEIATTIGELTKEIEMLESCYATVKEFLDHSEDKNLADDEGIAFLEAVHYVYSRYPCWD